LILTILRFLIRLTIIILSLLFILGILLGNLLVTFLLTPNKHIALETLETEQKKPLLLRIEAILGAP